MNDDVFILEVWPDTQIFMSEPDFNENACLADSDFFIEKYGSSAFFIRKSWADKIIREYFEDPDAYKDEY